MIRAVFFDFYSVWTPDKFSYYLAAAQQNGPKIYKEMSDIVEGYYHGTVDINTVADNFRAKLGHPDISAALFKMQASDVSSEIVNFMRELHGHFLKLGILANLGQQELALLTEFNEHNQVLEVIASPLSLQLPQPLMSKEVFSAALQAIGEPLASCLLVSGKLEYLQFAASLGMQTVQFEGFSDLRQAINKIVDSDLPQ